MWQHVVLCVLSFSRKSLDCACQSLCCLRLTSRQQYKFFFYFLKIPTFYLQVKANEHNSLSSNLWRYSTAVQFTSWATCLLIPTVSYSRSFPLTKSALIYLKSVDLHDILSQIQLWKTYLNISNTCNILLLLWLQHSDYTSGLCNS